MIELELFHSQLSSIMEVLVKSAIADIGKLMEDYATSLLEISRGRKENEAVKSKSVKSDQANTKSSRKECMPALGQRLEENCRSDQVAVPDCGHRLNIHCPENEQRDNRQTTLHQVCSKWNVQQTSQENYPQPEMCVQEHTHLTLKEEHIELLPCQVKKEMEVEETFLNTVPGEEASWSEEQHQICSIKMEPPTGGSIEPYGLSLTQPHLSSLDSVHQMESQSQSFDLHLTTLEPDLHTGTVGNPFPDHFPHSVSYANHAPYPDLDVSAEKSPAPGFAMAPGHDHEMAVARKPRNSSKFERFACRYCEQGFPYLSQLKRHMPKHTKERPFCCSLCGFCFTRMSHLKRHERSHTGDRPYACEVCGRCFIRKSHLDQHLKTHRRTALRYSAHCT